MQPNPLQHLMPTCSGAKAAAAGTVLGTPAPADSAHTDPRTGTVRLNEIFHSIQGESTWAGAPCVFVRLTGCPLRCTYCDTEYAFREGRTATLGEIVDAVLATGCPLVELTGGEPLAQKRSFDLIRLLCDHGLTVLIETSGALDISPCDERSIRILDIKTPGSGESARNLWSNIANLRARDEVKFVLTDRADYQWAVNTIAEHGLTERVQRGELGAILMSAAWAQPKGLEIAGCPGLSPRSLAEWIIADRLAVRMQTQMHKIIWEPQTRGV
ncbi:MAG: 7-carboxy-7-deazaguanine synthase [Planctomycetota bacterium]|jgi:7-carboxy-7-deazaguanine synthase